MVEAITGSSGHIGSHLVQRLESEHRVVRWPHNKDWPVDSIPDHIFHLATYGSHKTQTEVEKTILANYDLTADLIMSTTVLPYKALVITGSSSEYGRKNRPMREDDSLNPETIYAASK